MPTGNYKSKSKASVLYIKEILENFSSIENPLSNAEIKRILSQYPYKIDIQRETIKEILDELNNYDGDSYKRKVSEQEGTDGYSYGWYYNRSSSVYDDVKNIIEDIYSNPIVPTTMAKDKEKTLLSQVPKEIQETIKKESLKDVVIRQNEPDNKTYQTFNQIKQIIKDNKRNNKEEKHISFNINRYVIKNKKCKLEKIDRLPIYALPLAIVEWNYQLWAICYLDINDGKTINLKNKIGHYRIDLMSDIKVFNKPRTRDNKKKKAIAKLSSKDAIKKYMNEHIYFGSPKGNEYIEDNKIYTCTLRIKNNSNDAIYTNLYRNNYGITYFVDIFQDNFKIVEEQEDYYIVKVRCTQKSIENILLLYPDLIEIISPEELLVPISRKLKYLISNMLINTNQAVIRPVPVFNYEKMPGKVKDDEKWFYVDFSYCHYRFEDKVELFIKYLKNNGFKEKALKKIFDKDNRYLLSNKFNSFHEISNLIKEFGINNKWFYNAISSYSIYEYKTIFKEPNESNKDKKRFYRVYHYKGNGTYTKFEMSLSDYLARKQSKNKKEK